MSEIPEIGSVWVRKHNNGDKATIVWADELTVVYTVNSRSSSVRNVASTDAFLYSYKPKPRTITVNGVELPGPLREAPANVRNSSSTHSFLHGYGPKPRTITVNGVELPEPLREAPSIGEEYWFTSITESDGVCTDTWDGLPYELLMLKRGGIFRTKEDALAWVEFDVKLRGGEL